MCLSEKPPSIRLHYFVVARNGLLDPRLSMACKNWTVGGSSFLANLFTGPILNCWLVGTTSPWD